MPEKFNIYEDEKTKIQQSTSLEIHAEIDLSETKSFYDLIQPIRNFLKDKPEDFVMTVYFVSGKTCSKDIKLFTNYLKSVQNPIRIIFRGILHMEMMGLLLSYDEISLDQSCKLLYSKEKLHDFLIDLLDYPDFFRKFLQRFTEEYWKLQDGSALDITELNLLGIQFKTF